MRASYSLTAIPWPLGNGPNNGEHNERLEYVLFVATDGMQTHKWSVTNSGTLIEDLNRIVTFGNARDVYTRLLRGEPVLFPTLFDLQQIRLKFRGDHTEALRNCV